jgi:murein DD-endopeptidase MepM/ murein hydrolase activator NlpD
MGVVQVMRYPLKNIVVTQEFGEHPESYIYWGTNGHAGRDFSAVIGTPVFAAMPGKVSSREQAVGFGKYIKQDLGPCLVGLDGDMATFIEPVSTPIFEVTRYGVIGRVYLYYCHLSYNGRWIDWHVDGGQEIGRSGNTGNSTAPHLHFEMRIVGLQNEFKGAVDTRRLFND